MKIKLVKINNISGGLTSFYSVCYEPSEVTIFDEFCSQYRNTYGSQIREINTRLLDMGTNMGANQFFFKPKRIKKGDNVCILKEPHLTEMRLFCIKYGEKLVVLGGGGPKLKKIDSLASKNLLKKEQEKMSQISRLIDMKIQSGELEFSLNNMDFIGDFELV